MHFIFVGLYKLVKSLFIGFLITISLFTLNHFTNNKIAVVFNQVESVFFEYIGSCPIKNSLIHDNILYLVDLKFEKGFGSCFKGNSLYNIEKVYINDVYGGDVTEARILARKIKKYNIPVVIDGVCNSACVDVLLHSPDRTITINGQIGIHGYLLKSRIDIPYKEYLTRIEENSMLRAYNTSDVNISFLRRIMTEYPNNDIYYPSHKELFDNEIIHNFESTIINKI